MTLFNIRLNDGQKVSCARGQNILEACIAAGVAMPYNCRSGECAECRAVLLEGTVDEIPGADPAVFTDRDRGVGRILTCLCSPTSNIALDIVLRDGTAASKIEHANAKVVRVEHVSESVVQVELETSSEIAYRAGQYFEWGLPGILPNRNFSAANPPGSNRIIFDLRLYPNGKVSDHVSTSLRVDHEIELIGPYGHFGFSENTHRPALCVAGGTGLAPMKAMIQESLATNTGRAISLFYGTRGSADLYDLNLLESWSEQFPNFSYQIALSDEPADGKWDGARATVTDLVADVVYDGFGIEGYLCGPPAMIDSAIPILAAIGVAEEDIYSDRFSPAKGTGA